jgi:hypothetical protein
MNYFYFFLLLLVVLSAYTDSPQHSRPPDPLDLTVVAVCPNSSFDPSGVLAPVLSQNEISGFVLSQNMVLPQSEVFGSVLVVVAVGLPFWVCLGDAACHVIDVGTCCPNWCNQTWAGSSAVKRVLIVTAKVEGSNP